MPNQLNAAVTNTTSTPVPNEYTGNKRIQITKGPKKIVLKSVSTGVLPEGLSPLSRTTIEGSNKLIYYPNSLPPATLRSPVCGAQAIQDPEIIILDTPAIQGRFNGQSGDISEGDQRPRHPSSHKPSYLYSFTTGRLRAWIADFVVRIA